MRGDVLGREDGAERAQPAATKGFTEGIQKLQAAMKAGDKLPEMTPIEGVGADASWYASMKQLSVRKGAVVFHLTISKMGNDKAAALTLAKALSTAMVD
jgi:hypothetical protein